MILTQVTSQILQPQTKAPSAMFNEGIRVIDKVYGELYKEGEKLNELFFVIKGKVSLSKRNEWGRRVRLLSIAKGNFLGLPSLQNANISCHSARVCGPSRLLIIPLVSLPDFMCRWPSFRQQIINQLITHLDLLQAH